MVSEIEVNDLLKPVLLKDLRIQCRARGLNPAGAKESITERLKEHMLATGDLSLNAEFNGDTCNSVPSAASAPQTAVANNYSRPEGQNVGNFLTDRPTSRVLAPPGGGTQFSLGDGSHTMETTAKATVTVIPAAEPKDEAFGNHSSTGNNYTRPEGQNVGNFLGDRPSSRVLAPPGGGSQITFG